MKRKTTTEFIEESTIKHKGKFRYDNFIYINNTTGGVITCPSHGEFLQSPANHLKGQGCPKCGQEIKRQKRVQPQNEFIKKAIKKHGQYIYNEVKYINARTKVVIICPTHGRFSQMPHSHLSGSGCPKCYGHILKPKEELLEQMNKIHNYFYTYPLFDYVNGDKHIIIICPSHGEFKQTPEHHLRGYGCRKCRDEKLSLLFRGNFEELKIRSNKVHNDKYSYEKFIYVNYNTKGIIICPRHGEFKQSMGHHLDGKGCRKCGHMVSKKSQQWLDTFNNSNIVRECVLTINNKRYNTDGFDKTTNTVYEFYGDLWHGNPKRYNSEDKIFYGKTFGQLYSKTIKREAELKKAGYNVIIIWEDDFDKPN